MSLTTYTPETFPRRWLPADETLATWDEIEPWYRKLLNRPIGSPPELERWLADSDEVNSAVAQEGDERYIAMTCQTDDPRREAREAGDAEAPARLWGLALLTGDIDATAAATGTLLGDVRDAIQPGRRIATFSRDAELGAAVAVIS